MAGLLRTLQDFPYDRVWSAARVMAVRPAALGVAAAFIVVDAGLRIAASAPVVGLIALVAGLAMTPVAWAALTHAFVRSWMGDAVDVRESVEVGVRAFPYVAIVCLIGLVGAALGLFFFILPGLIVASVAAICVVLVVIERPRPPLLLVRAGALAGPWALPIMAMVVLVAIVWVTLVSMADQMQGGMAAILAQTAIRTTIECVLVLFWSALYVVLRALEPPSPFSEPL